MKILVLHSNHRYMPRTKKAALGIPAEWKNHSDTVLLPDLEYLDLSLHQDEDHPEKMRRVPERNRQNRPPDAMGIQRFMMKPLTKLELGRTVRQILDQGGC